MLVSFAELQNAYNKLYVEVRKYVWDFSVVAALADLEIAVYETCQDLPDIRTKFNRFKSLIMDVVYTDENLRKRLELFEELLDAESTYVKLNQVNEVIQI